MAQPFPLQRVGPFISGPSLPLHRAPAGTLHSGAEARAGGHQLSREERGEAGQRPRGSGRRARAGQGRAGAGQRALPVAGPQPRRSQLGAVEAHPAA